MKSYKPRQFLAGDIISGLCVAQLNAPLCLGYAVLAGLPPVYGLYASFYPLVVYFFFGTSRQSSMGTMTMVSVLINNVIKREAHLYTPTYPDLTGHANDTSVINSSIAESSSHVTQTLVQYKVDIALSMAFMVGLIQMAMSFLRLGGMSDFMSPQFLNALLSGGACLIMTSQVPFLLGFSKLTPKFYGNFTFLKNWYWIFKNLPKTNLADFLISLICCTILIVIRNVINVRFKKKLPAPLPAETIVVSGVVLASYFGHFSTAYNVVTVESLPTGLPVPKIPGFTNITDFMPDVLVIVFVSLAVNMSQARAMAHKHGYFIEPNQELLASGACQVITSIFGGFGGAAMAPRTALADSTGRKTQVGGLVGALGILLVCLVLARFLEPLPMAALASIVVVPILSVPLLPITFPSLWRKDRFDCIISVVTFLVVVLVSIPIGVACGIGASLIALILRTRLAKTTRLSPIVLSEGCPDLFAKVKRCKTGLLARHGIAIVKFDCLLYFANANAFIHGMYKLTVNPVRLKRQRRGLAGSPGDSECPPTNQVNANVPGDSMATVWSTARSGEAYSSDVQRTHIDNTNLDNPVESVLNAEPSSKRPNYTTCSESTKIIILDCSSISRIDMSGANAINQVRAEYESVNIRLWLAACSLEIIDVLRRNKVDLSWGVYPSIQDAMQHATTVLRADDTEISHL